MIGVRVLGKKTKKEEKKKKGGTASCPCCAVVVWWVWREKGMDERRVRDVVEGHVCMCGGGTTEDQGNKAS